MLKWTPLGFSLVPYIQETTDHYKQRQEYQHAQEVHFIYKMLKSSLSIGSVKT